MRDASQSNTHCTYLQKFSFFLCLIILVGGLVLTGCKGSSKQGTQNTEGEQESFILPEAKTIPAAELQRIQSAADLWFDKYIANSNFNGSILLAKGGKIVYEKFKADAAINSHTAFHLASVSKTFTAMTVLKLAQDKKLNLDDPFSKYFPAFNYPGVTIRTLLNHRSGLPNYIYFMERMWPDKTVAVKNTDILNYLVTKKDSLSNINRADLRYAYNNTNYALLGLLIEKVTGVPYAEYLQQTIFTPLKMDDSFVYTTADSASVLMSYDRRHGMIPYSYLDDVYGDKNIYSTTHDLLRWDRLLRSNLFLSDSSLALAYTPYSNEKPGIKNYGLGWHLNVYPNGKKLVFHNGWWHGNTSAFYRLQDEDVTIIALNNHLSYVTYKVKLLADIFYPYFEDTEEEIE